MSWFDKFRIFKKPIPMKADIVVFGLGNPEEKYRYTRHNIGFRVADAFLDSMKSVKTSSTKDYELFFGTSQSGKQVAIVKPLTYMNQSGIAVEAVTKKLNIELASTMVIVDDFHIPLKTIRIRKSGSPGGHNGLKSIEAHVGSEYPRLRVGVGPLPENTDIIEFVLGQFSEQEEDLLKKVIPTAVAALNAFIDEGIEVTISKFNK